MQFLVQTKLFLSVLQYYIKHNIITLTAVDRFIKYNVNVTKQMHGKPEHNI